MRAIVQGVADALDDPEVQLAFRILYEDMSPLVLPPPALPLSLLEFLVHCPHLGDFCLSSARPQRFCGDRIFNHIDKLVTEGGKKLLEFAEKSEMSEVGCPPYNRPGDRVKDPRHQASHSVMIRLTYGGAVARTDCKFCTGNGLESVHAAENFTRLCPGWLHAQPMTRRACVSAGRSRRGTQPVFDSGPGQ